MNPTLSLGNALRLEIPQEHGGEVRSYSLEDLRELQNKLMLMSGRGEQDQAEVDRFSEAFSGVQRLAAAFIELHAAGNPLFRRWEAKVSCCPRADAGIVMDFHLGSAAGEMAVQGEQLEQLPLLCRKMERFLTAWSDFMDEQRSAHYYLNYYSAEQVVYLCERLSVWAADCQLDVQAATMLSFVGPECGRGALKQALILALQGGLLAEEEGEAGRPADGSGELDLVWDAYMRDMRGFLQHTLDVPSLGTLLGTLAEGADEEGEGQRKVVSRSLPGGFSSGRPNLVVCPQGEALASCLCVYMASEREPLPTYDEVLLCDAATPYQQVELFLRRCLTAGYRGRKIYTLLHAERLAYDVSWRAERLFQRLTLLCAHDYGLVILCSAGQEHAYLPSAFSRYRLLAVPQQPLERVRSYLSRHYAVPPDQPSAAGVFKHRQFVGVVSSKRPGVGKSLYIQRLYERLQESANGENSLLKCIRLTESRVDENAIVGSLLGREELAIFHFDVTSSVQKGLHEFLFRLLVLRYLMDAEGHMWKYNSRQLYIIEILRSAQDARQNEPRSGAYAHYSFLDVFPAVFCRPPKEVLELEMRGQDGAAMGDPLMDDQEFRSEAYQRPYQYLIRFHNAASLDRFAYTGVEGTHVECLQMLFLYCGVLDPSWAELRNFAGFLNEQLRDCEKSVYCNANLVGDTLQGFRNFVVDFMILMAKDFATPSLSISDQSSGKQQVDLTRVSEEDLAPFRIRKRWESEPHPYVFFNDDHVSMTFIGFHLRENAQSGLDAVHPTSGVVIKRNVMTKQLYDGLRRQGVRFDLDFDGLPRDEKITCLCRVLGVQWPTDPDQTYELTIDNVLKMLAIHMRLRCGIPVIVMGETGCGKTRLVRFLCELRRSGADVQNMTLVKVHGGTTSQMIYSKVRRAEAEAAFNKREHGLDTVLFFDEANTTEAVSSIKEEALGADDTEAGVRGSGVQSPCRGDRGQAGIHPLRQLVYRVQVLPPSLIPLVWDFGQLNDQTEKIYIQQIVRRVVQTSCVGAGCAGMITDVLSSSQRYMRARRDECSFVSLRDVERCMRAFLWFYNNHAMFRNQNPEETKGNQTSSEDDERRDSVVWALVMAVGVCYHACLENKDGYRSEIAKASLRASPHSGSCRKSRWRRTSC
ncbi:hypothetical protein AAFF_G00101320 [Aldrovandia affinis]|uniref:Ring finger protein 213 n=1 Tax=Aldrovandia affinis TaxID=143900 RepID=A0AAD7RUU9_9TELE|nr:hypothetical protein AAFF_G00101320 [Aldrovandia affinis]